MSDDRPDLEGQEITKGGVRNSNKQLVSITEPSLFDVLIFGLPVIGIIMAVLLVPIDMLYAFSRRVGIFRAKVAIVTHIIYAILILL